MSTVKVNTLTGVSTAGSIAVTGEGNSTTTNLQQGLAKAWSHLNFSGASVHDSLNQSSITDLGTGKFSVDTTSALGNSDYSVVTSACNAANSTSNTNRASQGTAVSSSQYYMCATIISSHTSTDAESCSGAVHGDLA